MKILITGGNGFIGRNILQSTIAQKYMIIAPSSKELDCRDQASVDDFFKKNQVDIVIHSAVKPGHRNAKDFNDLLKSNTMMFFNLERHSDKYKKMLVIGSGAIYDNRYYSPKMKESDYQNSIPVDDHGYCKYICEKVIEKSKNIYDLRVFGVFGKYEDYSIRFISNAICKAIFDLPITIKQDRKFDYIDVDDFTDILDFFIENTPKYHSYNITPDNSILLSELANIVLNVSQKQLPVKIAQPGLGLEYSGDNYRLKEEMKKSLTPIETSIKKLYEWYNQNSQEIDYNKLLTDK